MSKQGTHRPGNSDTDTDSQIRRLTRCGWGKWAIAGQLQISIAEVRLRMVHMDLSA